MRFEAFLGLLPPRDLSLFSSRALHGAAHFLSFLLFMGLPTFFRGTVPLFCAVFLYEFGRCPFVARPRFVFFFFFVDAPFPLLVAFTPAFIL